MQKPEESQTDERELNNTPALAPRLSPASEAAVAEVRDRDADGEELEQDSEDVPALREVLPPWSELSDARRMAVLEALIFAAERPLTFKELREMLGIRTREILRIADLIRADLNQHKRGLTLEEIAEGLVFRTRAELSPWIRAMLRTRPPRISRAQLETLAIVAYRQPATRAEVEQVRGVESGHLLRALLERRLVRILGRKDDVGRPMIYGTTREFLQMFGLKDLSSLPTLRDLASLMGKKQGPEPREDEAEHTALAQPAAPMFPLERETPRERTGGEILDFSGGDPLERTGGEILDFSGGDILEGDDQVPAEASWDEPDPE